MLLLSLYLFKGLPSSQSRLIKGLSFSRERKGRGYLKEREGRHNIREERKPNLRRGRNTLKPRKSADQLEKLKLERKTKGELITTEVLVKKTQEGGELGAGSGI